MAEVSHGTPAAGLRRRAKRWLCGSLVLFAVAVGLFVSMAMGWIMPPLYESTAVIRITAVAEGGEELTAEEAATVMEAEARRVAGVPTFDRVRDRLGLLERWETDADGVRGALREAVEVEPVPESGLIRIHVRRRDATEARVLALAMAEAYRDLRNAEELDKAKGMMQALDAELEEQEREVEQKRKALERLLEESGLGHMEQEEQAALRRDLLRKQEKLEDDLRFLQELHGDSLYRHAAGLERVQNSASLLYGEFERVERAIVRLGRAGFGASHPRVVAQDVQRSLLKVELDRCVKRLVREVDSERQRVAGRLARLERRMAEPAAMAPAAALAVANRMGHVPIWHAVGSARAELAAEQELCAELQLRRRVVEAAIGAPPVGFTSAEAPGPARRVP